MKKRLLFALFMIFLFETCTEAPKQPPNSEQAPTTPDSQPSVKTTPQSIVADTAKTSFWRCFGTEPFWSVEISEAKNTLTYKPMEGDSLVMPFIKSDEPNDTWIFNATKFKVVIKKEKCSDGMSDVAHDYSANVRVGSGELKGCARRL